MATLKTALPLAVQILAQCGEGGAGNRAGGGATNDAYSKPGAEEREAKERQKRRKVDYSKSTSEEGARVTLRPT